MKLYHHSARLNYQGVVVTSIEQLEKIRKIFRHNRIDVSGFSSANFYRKTILAYDEYKSILSFVPERSRVTVPDAYDVQEIPYDEFIRRLEAGDADFTDTYFADTEYTQSITQMMQNASDLQVSRIWYQGHYLGE